MNNTIRLLFVALLVGFVPLGASACGGEDPDKLLEQTFGSNRPVKSGRLTAALSLRAEGLPQLRGPVSLRLTGPFENQGAKQPPRFDFNLALSSSGQAFRLGAVSTGQTGFLSFQGQSYSVPPELYASFKQGLERARAQQGKEGSKQNPTFASLGVDPRKWLRDAEVQDDEEVGGTETKHITAKVDVGRMLEDVNRLLTRARQRGPAQTRQLPGSITADQRKRAEEAIKSASFDVWTGKDDKILRKLEIKLKFDVPEGQRPAASGLSGGDLGLVLQIAALNQPQQIKAPRGSRPFTELQEAIRQLGSVVGGGGAAQPGTPAQPAQPGQPAPPAPPASGGTGAAPGGGATSPQAQAYVRCLQQAGNDLAKAQRCAALIGR